MIEKDILLNNAKQDKDLLVTVRRHIHQNPELSFQEYNTQIYLEKKLKELGITDVKHIGDTGLAIIIEGKGKGECIALRADMDALPIQEANEVPYKSQNDGIMHACGHDVHSAALLGAIKLLHETRQKWNGKVLAIFQPGEEKLPGGANKIIDSGIFEKLKPRLIIGQHVMPEMPVGTIGFRAGTYMASTDEIYIDIEGKGGHAAVPELTKDTVSCASEIILSLKNGLQEMSKDIPVIFSIGKVIANGSTNIIPSEVKMEGTLRTMDEQFRKYAKTQMHLIVGRISEQYGVKATLKIIDGYPSLSNHSSYTTEAIEFMEELLGSKNVKTMDLRMTGEDFAYYSQIMPAIFYRLGIADEYKGNINVHNNHFDINEDALTYGSCGLAWLAIRFLTRINS